MSQGPPGRPVARPRPTAPGARPGAPTGEVRLPPPPGPGAPPHPPDTTRVPRTAGKGRRIDAGPDPASEPPKPEAAGPQQGGPLSPFQGYGAAPPSGPQSSEPLRVVGMLAALGLAGGAAIAVVLAVVCSGVAIHNGMTATDAAEKVATDDTDLEIKGPRAVKPKPQPKGGAAAPEPEAPSGPLPEAFGTITLDLKPGQVFNSIEAKCPSTPLIRRRAEVRASKVTIKLPPEEDCRITFQGSSPESTLLHGGQTKTCSFSPTVCR